MKIDHGFEHQSKPRRYITLVLMGLLILSGINILYAHGEDATGPHGGFIRMPGAFHTELVPINARSFDVYLLDINWKSPIVADSSVGGSVLRGGSQVDLVCAASGDRFRCTMKPERPLTPGDVITILATRAGQSGVAVEYDYPLTRSHR